MEVMRFCIDIDGTLCENLHCDNEKDYSKSDKYTKVAPYQEMIDMVNFLYDSGDTIIIHTARGMSNGTDMKEMTEKQLKQWGVKYHELVMNKPRADYYVDDKAMLPGDLVGMMNSGIESGDEQEH